MINLLPYTFDQIENNVLFSNDAGDFFISNEKLLDRILSDELTENDCDYLLRKGFAFNDKDDFYYNSYASRLKIKQSINKNTNYIIAIPTLRCDLACSYCQVSRANENALGYDWTEEILSSFKQYLLKFSNDAIKIEFQGGEPSLRLDLIRDIVNFCDENRINASYVLCTNLNRVSSDLINLLENPLFFISTSIDGSSEIHTENRTGDFEITSNVNRNYRQIVQQYGADKINALPTITDNDPDNVRSLIDYYVEMGQKNIFLRPVNYHGFARKNFHDESQQAHQWIETYLQSIDYIWRNNFENNLNVKEVGIENAIKRIFLPNYNSYVDLRSPNPALRDYMVINYDGEIYPSDEARMMSRIGLIDLSMGNIQSGINNDKKNEYNWNSMNEIHEDCIHCAFKPFCGIDTVDELSRYQRIDMPKHETYFCKVNTAIFKHIFSRINKADPIALFNINGHLTGDFSMKTCFSEWKYD